MRLVDLFAGCGGFSLGAHQAGFNVAAAFDLDPILTSSYAFNFPTTNLVLHDVARLDGDAVRVAAGSDVQGIFGGPPCQGFSAIGRRDVNDPRRDLLGHFFRIVSEVEPPFFVMENVRGLLYADARDVLYNALSVIEDRYAIFGPVILDAADFGAATQRKRLFVIGIHKDYGEAITDADIAEFKRSPATVRSALADLENAEFIRDIGAFDQWRITKRGPAHSYARSLRALDGTFTSHRITQHKADIEKRFASVPQGSVDPIGRHPRLHWDRQCPTLRAGTGSDLGSYQAVRPLHPDNPRVITVREAARLQGFPDSHRFHSTVWHSFRMIGNSVSPVIAQAIFSVVRAKIGWQEQPAIAAE
jgi:DNA (cytosine-5)-methyltransferase 1